MTPSRAAAIAAIVASVGLSAFTPAMAAGPRDTMRPHRMLDFRAGNDGRFQFAQFTCAPKAADRMEHRFDKLADRLKLSDEQKKLYDAFMTSALTAQTDFADKCADLRPERATRADRKQREERPDLLDRMETRLKLDEARLAAMNTVYPDFKAFYSSLSEQQQADLFPFGKAGHHHPMKPNATGLGG
jgi:hypothetical protein